MPNNHAVVNLMHCAAWDVDAYNIVGICETDVDNATLLSVGNITTNAAQSAASGVVIDFAYNVSVPAQNATGLWIAKTPIPGTSTDLAVQTFSDPRYFYNKAGEPISLAYLQAGVDVIEVTGDAFATGSAPTDQPTYDYVSVNTSGKLVVANAEPASGTYFTILGRHTIDCGQELVPSYILKCMRN